MKRWMVVAALVVSAGCGAGSDVAEALQEGDTGGIKGRWGQSAPTLGQFSVMELSGNSFAATLCLTDACATSLPVRGVEKFNGNGHTLLQIARDWGTVPAAGCATLADRLHADTIPVHADGTSTLAVEDLCAPGGTSSYTMVLRGGEE
jgi:hypothetical protein